MSLEFRFFGQVYADCFVSCNGVITFLSEPFTVFPETFPNTNDIMIAAYWTDLSAFAGGGVFYQYEFNQTILEEISEDIRSNFPRHRTFSGVGAYIVTYNNVPSFGCDGSNLNDGDCGLSCDSVVNFQVILTSDGLDSFVIFLYDRLEYTVGAFFCTAYAQIGFNAGDGVRYYTFLSSNTPNISSFALTQSNVNIPGKWMFSVADDISGP